MSESKILTSEEVGKIEAHLKRWDRGEVSKQTFPVSWKNADALCATVRHLLEEKYAKKIELLKLSGRGELLKKEHVNVESLDEMDAVRNEFDRLHLRILELETEIDTSRGYM